MIKVTLSKRLLAVANMFTNTKVVADIGCDHALLDIYLLQNSIVSRVIASDITLGAVNQAKKNIQMYQAKNIDIRQGDGLDTINSNDIIDTIVMSGLGNKKISDILYNSREKLDRINTIIIQSNTDIDLIRYCVTKLGYYISNEALVKDNNIIYVVIKFEKGFKKYSKKELFFGTSVLRKDLDLYSEYYNDIVKNNNKIISKIPKKYFIKRIKLMYINKLITKEIKKSINN